MSPLDRILDLTRQVEAQVDRGDWLAAGALDQERRQLLETLIADNHLQQLGPNARAVLQEILARNQQTVGKVQNHKTQLAAISTRLNQAPDAMRAYRANAQPLAPLAPGPPTPEEA